MLKRKDVKIFFLILRLCFALYCFGSSVINVALIVHKNIFYPRLMISATFVIIYGKFYSFIQKFFLSQLLWACYRALDVNVNQNIFRRFLLLDPFNDTPPYPSHIYVFVVIGISISNAILRAQISTMVGISMECETNIA